MTFRFSYTNIRKENRMSKKRFIGVIAMLAIVILLVTGCGVAPATVEPATVEPATVIPATAVPTLIDPVTVVQQFQEAVNMQDIESALEFFTDDAVLKLDETSSITGKDAIANWLATQAELHYQFTGDPITSESGVNFENCLINSYQWSYYGLKVMSGRCEVTVDGELVTEFAVQFDEESKASLSASSVVTPLDLVGIWSGEWPKPGADPHDGEITLNHLQFNEGGSARLAVTPDDLLVNPDSDHPGARFTWTYENYVLTLQNDGPASEGYCLEQDVGTYLIRNVESVSGKRMQFKLVKDSCAYRATALPRISAPWDAYVP